MVPKSSKMTKNNLLVKLHTLLAFCVFASSLINGCCFQCHPSNYCRNPSSKIYPEGTFLVQHMRGNSGHNVNSLRLKVLNKDESSEAPSSVNFDGSVINAAALVAGNTIGAGIIALPTVSLQTGFVTSSLLLTVLWLYNFLTGLLIAEVATNMGKDNPKVGSILEIAGQTLGKTSAKFASGLSLILNYLLMVAYVAEGGRYLMTGLNLDSATFMNGAGAILFTAAVAVLMTGGSTVVELVNNGFCLMLFVAFTTLIAVGAPEVSAENLLHLDVASTLSVVPVGVAALVYQNMVPVISNQLGHEEKKVKTALLYGSGIPLLLYIIYDAVILGSVPAVAGAAGLSSMSEGPFSLPGFSDALAIFSISAIVTSFIGSIYSVGAEIDGVLAKLEDRFDGIKNKVSSGALTLLPPALIATSGSQDLFLEALGASGSLDNALYGLLPVAMAWVARYNLDITDSTMVPGGKGTLVFLGALATILIFVH